MHDLEARSNITEPGTYTTMPFNREIMRSPTSRAGAALVKSQPICPVFPHIHKYPYSFPVHAPVLAHDIDLPVT